MKPKPSRTRRRLESREDTIMTSIALPRALHRETTLAALTLNWSFAEVMRTALQEWLDRHQLAGGRP